MEELVNELSMPKKGSSIITVIGVGGAGGNALNYMWNIGIKDVNFLACNTDQGALDNLDIPNENKIVMGPGLGAGNDPKRGEELAVESLDQIKQFLEARGTKMVFIAAGMGGGTGTGATPVIARISKELGILTVGIVTLPFIFEGFLKITKALQYIEEMRKHVDALLIINNERLCEMYPSLTFLDAFSRADDVLATAASSIIEIIVKNGYINCDFRDVRTTLLNGGTAIISTGYGEGENRVTAAIEDAIRSPLLKNADIYTSKKLLIVIYLSPDPKYQMQLSESGEITAFTSRFVNSPDIITGVYFDDTIDEKMKITILASGFDANDYTEKTEPAELMIDMAQHDIPAVISNSIKHIYSPDALHELERNRWQIVVLTPEQMNNENLLNLFDSEPTYARSSDFRKRLQNAAAGCEEVPAEEQQQPVINNMTTINFG